MPQLVLDSSGVIPGCHHWPPARLPDQGSLKETSWPSGDNLDCQPRLLAIPGLGHPRPLVIRRHPWPSRGNLGCQPWLVVTPDLGHPWSFGLQETSPAIGRQPWLPPLATSSTSRPGVTEGDILASARASTSLAHQPCSSLAPALLTSLAHQPCSSLAHQPCSSLAPALLQPCSSLAHQPCSPVHLYPEHQDTSVGASGESGEEGPRPAKGGSGSTAPWCHRPAEPGSGSGDKRDPAENERQSRGGGADGPRHHHPLCHWSGRISTRELIPVISLQS